MNTKRILTKLSHPWVLPIYPIILIAFLYKDILIHHDAISTHDNINWYAAFNYFLLCLARGELPMWDPYSYSGAPFYLNYNIVGALDPTVIIFAPLARYFNLSALDAFHYHHMLWNLIFLVGAYSLFHHITQQKWRALFGATVATLIMIPSGLWAQGQTMVITYAPLTFSILLKLVSPNTSAKSKGYLFISACYLIGLSCNLYLPSFLFVFLSMALIYLLATKSVRFVHLWQSFTAIGLAKGLAGIIIFIITTGPFFYSLHKMLPETGEVFSLTRLEKDPQSNILVHTEKLHLAKASSAYQASIHNLMSGFIPGPDSRFFSPYQLGMTEIFFTFGMIPLVIVLTFFREKSNSYKGLFIFLTLIMGFYLFGPNLIYKGLLKYFPGASSIRQQKTFLGLFILAFCGLLAVSFPKITSNSNKSDNPNTSLWWLLVVFICHVTGIYLYLDLMYRDALKKSFPMDFFNLTQNSITENGWVLILSYLIVAAFLAITNRWLRYGLATLMVCLSLHQIVDFNIHLKRYLTQPNNVTHDGYAHYDREFEYVPLRVPYVPRHTAIWGYLPAFYRVPAAVPPYFNDYMSMTRRTYDYVRFTSAQRQRIISGIATKRFGFFDKYAVVNNSTQALSFIGRMSGEDLKNILILEEDPAKIINKANTLSKVDPKSMTLSMEWVKGKNQRMVRFYDYIQYINYELSDTNRPNSFLGLTIPKNSSALHWPWDTDHIGYFQLLFGNYLKSTYHKLFNYYPNPGIRFQQTSNSICVADFKEWLMKHALSGYYKTIYNQYPFPCDIRRIDNKLLISPELQGIYVTDDILPPEKDFLVKGFSIISLDPEKVTPNKSPYARDEPTEVIDFGPNNIEFKIHNSKPGLFYYADSFSDDWKAQLDGSPAHIFKANFNFKAIYVPKGEHVVTMRFHPAIFVYVLWSFIILTVPLLGLPFYSLWLENRDTLREKHLP